MKNVQASRLGIQEYLAQDPFGRDFVQSHRPRQKFLAYQRGQVRGDEPGRTAGHLVQPDVLGQRHPPGQDGELLPTQGLVRQREDSVFQFRKANRPELVQKEEKEIALLKSYLPAEASAADIDAAVERAVAETGASSPRDMGKAMKAAMAVLEAQGKPADGRKLSDAMRKRLGA